MTLSNPLQPEREALREQLITLLTPGGYYVIGWHFNSTAFQTLIDFILSYTQAATAKAVLEARIDCDFTVEIMGGENNIKVHLVNPKDVATYYQAIEAIKSLATLNETEGR